jgi:hypothetical protein
MSARVYLNADGALVAWDALDAAEQAFHAVPAPWVVNEFGMTIAEYVCWHWNEVALAEFYFESDNAWYLPDVP